VAAAVMVAFSGGGAMIALTFANVRGKLLNYTPALGKDESLPAPGKLQEKVLAHTVRS
jgi:hypothetical protein